MFSFNVTVVLVALLAALAVAVPNPTRTINRRPLGKRSFKVERAANPNALARTNGMAAMRKVFRKYGFEHPTIDTRIVVSNDNALNLTNKAGGLVSANPEDGAALFLSPVNIGGQTLNLDFDSGSSDLWVFSTSLNQATIGQHAAFNPGQSTSFKASQGATWQISYGDGSGAAGTVGTDVVNIGGATVTGQAVELATAVSQSFVQDTATDGLVGLAFSNLNTVKPQQQKTFFENLLPTLQEPVFTADLRNDASGSYEFGRIDQTKFQGQMTFAPVDAASGFWKVDSKFFTIGGKRVENPQANAAIAGKPPFSPLFALYPDTPPRHRHLAAPRRRQRRPPVLRPSPRRSPGPASRRLHVPMQLEASRLWRRHRRHVRGQRAGQRRDVRGHRRAEPDVFRRRTGQLGR